MVITQEVFIGYTIKEYIAAVTALVGSLVPAPDTLAIIDHIKDFVKYCKDNNINQDCITKVGNRWCFQLHEDGQLKKVNLFHTYLCLYGGKKTKQWIMRLFVTTEEKENIARLMSLLTMGIMDSPVANEPIPAKKVPNVKQAEKHEPKQEEIAIEQPIELPKANLPVSLNSPLHEVMAYNEEVHNAYIKSMDETGIDDAPLDMV